MKKSRLLGAVCALCSVLVTTHAYSALVQVDWKTPGDGLLTRDTDTGLEWLDTNQSRNWSYPDIINEFGAGGLFEGFRHATLDEVITLQSNAGLVQHSGAYNYGDEQMVLDYILMRGATKTVLNSDGSLNRLVISAVNGTPSGTIDHIHGAIEWTLTLTQIDPPRYSP